MIPRAYTTEWRKKAPWKTNAQIEQDLIIERTIVELFTDDFISENLAFRGGTALHKLYVKNQQRYSEDIDLVQIKAVPYGPIIDRIRKRLNFLGRPKRDQKIHNNTLTFYFDSEYPPIQRLKLKIETNCREHFTVLDYKQHQFEVKSGWFAGSCELTTYKLEELLGTKLRALYQRSKGRDLFDLYSTLKENPDLNKDEILFCFKEYMQHSTIKPPGKTVFLKNIDKKMQDPDFNGDVYGLLRTGVKYDPIDAYELVKKEIIEKF